MKKFYSFVFAAVALVGFAACNSDSVDEAAPVQKGETVTFVANIDTTRTGLEGFQTTWVNGDKVVIGTYTFTFDGNKFSCTTDGVKSLLNTEVTAIYSNNGDGKVDPTAGVAGAVLEAKGTLTQDGTLNFYIKSAFLKYTYTGDSDLVVSLNGATVSTTKGTDVYVAFMPEDNTTLAYTLDGVECKTTTINFTAGKVYNLGKLLKKSQTWAIAGQFQGWDVSANKVAPMYELGNNMFVAYNLKDLNNVGFKFVMDYGWDKAVGSNGTTTTNNWTNCGNQNLLTDAADAYDVYFDAEYLQYYIVAADSEAPAAITGTRTIYFKPGADWEKEGAYFEVWAWGDGFDAKWSRFVWVEGSGANAVYSTKIHANATGMKIIRKYADKPTCDWNGQADSGDVTFDANKNMYTLSTKSWSTR